jgi:hypothetical protein
VVEARVYAGRGDRAALETTLAEVSTETTHTNIEYQGGPLVARAIAYNALDRPAEALAAAEALALSGVDVPNEDRREAFMEAGIAALALGDRGTVQRLIAHVGEMPLALRSPMLRAGAARFSGLLALQDGDHGRAGHALTEAARLLRGIGARFFLGQVLLEHAEALDATSAASDAAALRAEAIEIFTALRATPWLQRARSESQAAV